MATPIYAGVGQPTVNGGWLAGLGAWFGTAVPVYAGEGQPLSTSSGYLGGSTPIYKTAPSASNVGETISRVVSSPNGNEPERITLVIPRELLEQQ